MYFLMYFVFLKKFFKDLKIICLFCLSFFKKDVYIIKYFKGIIKINWGIDNW